MEVIKCLPILPINKNPFFSYTNRLVCATNEWIKPDWEPGQCFVTLQSIFI